MTARERRIATTGEAEDFFSGSHLGITVFRRVHEEITACGPCDLTVARTQVGWARHRGFAFLWQPGRWLRQPVAEVVLTIALPRQDPSPRWKQVALARPGLYVHHLELHSVDDIDAEVTQWLAEAYACAG